MGESRTESPRVVAKRFVGKTVVVTGGASGIGRVTALQFAAEGAIVAIVDLNDVAAEQVLANLNAASVNAISQRADVTDSAQVAVAFAQIHAAVGPPDVLVNNASAAGSNDILTITPEAWRADLASALDSAYLCTREALPGMIARGAGSIVNVSSVNALVGIGGEGYSAGKAGLISLTQNLAVRYGRSGIRANAVVPGTIRTPIWGNRLAEDSAEAARLLAMYPLGRLGEPEDVAEAILFLSSSAASWISGAILSVDGGLMAGGGFQGLIDEAPRSGPT